jgi:hypothetical protein
MVDFENYDSKDLAYDLRQRYAKLVGDHFELVAQARINRNYGEYFRTLEDLYTVSIAKFKKKEESKKKYQEIKKELIEVSHKNAQAWNGTSQDPNEVAEVEEALRKIERFLWEKMIEANMMGSKEDDRGL